MAGHTQETELLTPLIEHRIGAYDACYEIAERPNLGRLAAPIGICTLINDVLGYALYLFMMCESTKVWIRCERDTTSTIILEVKADCALLSGGRGRIGFKVGELNQRACSLRGDVVFGGDIADDDRPSFDVFLRLTVPIPV